MGEKLLIERPPIGADAYRLVVPDRGFDDGAELPVLFFLEADIARIDAIFIERLGARGVVGEELVADIVEVADDRHVDIHTQQPLLDVRHGGSRLVTVDRYANEFRAGTRERGHLPGRAFDVGGIRVGHRLHHDRCAAADGDVAHLHGNCSMPFRRAGKLHHRKALVFLPVRGQGINIASAEDIASARPIYEHQTGCDQRHGNRKRDCQRLFE